MIKYRQPFGVLLLLLLSATALAQNNTNSPYTRYGYGQLTEQGSANSKAMGGIAYGLRDGMYVNFANPATYTAVDSLTFIFDGSIGLQNTNFSDGSVKRNAKNSSFDYITMQFRLAKWAGMSIGLLPYSNIGYSMTSMQTDETNSANSSAVTYSGSGGLHQVYMGVGVKIIKNLSVGANLSYLWGDVTHSRAQSYSSSTPTNAFSEVVSDVLRSYKVDFGLQYTQRFGAKHAATLGLVYSPGHNLHNTGTVATTVTTTTVRDTTLTMGIPNSMGGGIAYVYDNRLTVGADVLLQNWDKVTFMNNADAFSRRTRFSVGAEYLPTRTGRNYFSVIKYRIGGYYSQPYYKIDGVRAATEYGVSVGFGLPLQRTASTVNLTAQYVRVQAADSRFLTENTFRISVGITFNERWFRKLRVQ
ncbi:MAG: hypothetical protein LBN06_06920 [Prevotellaceae bacterium]|jgi:hypothetical protein|nr:hypothetical protein [Prevotellaceae bacterium]